MVQRLDATSRPTTGDPGCATPLSVADRALLAVDGTWLGIWELDVATGRVLTSSATHHLLGVGTGTAGLRTWVRRLHPDDLKRLRQAFANHHADPDTPPFWWHGRMRHSDGRWVWVEVMGRLYPDGRAIGTLRDIEFLKAQENAIRQARVAAERASHAKSDFLANMSHELRTPITGVLGIVDLLLASAMTGEQRRFMVTLKESAETLLTVLNDILDISKIEAGQLTLERISFAPRARINTVIDLLRPMASQKGLALDLVLPDDLPRALRGDPTRLQQVLFNLGNNAIKFTERGRVEVKVARVTAAGDGHELRFEVRDTGIGIPQEAQGKLFDSFTQADATTSRRFGGTGLGLAICKTLVGMMDGDIGVSSVPDLGSLFWFTARFGRGDVAEAQALERKPAPPSEPQPALAAGTRMLVAEDNEVNRMIIRLGLEGMGHRVDVVENGREAVAQAGDEEYDLIFMDMQMPVMDGLEATRAIRDLTGPGGAVPIIALTADAMPEHRQTYLDSGVDAVLTKPIDWDRIRAEIERLVGAGERSDPARADGAAPADTGRAVISQGRLSDLASRMGAEPLRTVIAFFPDAAAGELAQLKHGVAARDPRAVHRAAHSLKGLAENIGAEALADRARAIEAEALDSPAIARLVDEMAKTIDHTRDALRQDGWLD